MLPKDANAVAAYLVVHKQTGNSTESRERKIRSERNSIRSNVTTFGQAIPSRTDELHLAKSNTITKK